MYKQSPYGPHENAPRRKKVNTEEGSPHWMTTFSDMVTLLLTFFILLYSISIIDVERFQKIIVSIQTSFLGYTGIMDQSPSPTEGSETERSFDQGFFTETANLERVQRIEEVLTEVRSFLGETGLEGAVELRLEERGIVMEMPDYIFFERARADLRDEARQVLDQLSDLFRRLDEPVIIEGHTCNLPISSPEFPSNWELSVMRSVRVTRYLVETQGLEPQRFTATGYGEYQPLQSNDTPEGRARNRRVTIVISL
ncbi:MAG: OmpA family protein [Bacillota bacterium]